jgi:hypothetical protein
MDFVLDNKEFTTAQQQNIRCRLNKKAKELLGTELLIHGLRATILPERLCSQWQLRHIALQQTNKNDTKRAQAG